MPIPENLSATAILDYQEPTINVLASGLRQEQSDDRRLLQAAHRHLATSVKPIYTLEELQPASQTMRKQHGSCSQRMACLEAVSRACGVPTRARALRVSGKFWYPRFQTLRAFIPKSILLIWPQFFLAGAWIDFDELYGSVVELAGRAEHAFSNDGESIFDAIDHTPIDFMAKTCGPACSNRSFDLSGLVLADEGFFNTRDEVFGRFGSLRHTLRGELFEVVFGGRKSV